MDKKEAIQSSEVFGTTLLTVAVDDFSMEILGWEPETLEMDLRDKYGDIIPQNNIDRLESAIGLLTSNVFYKSLYAFCTVCRTLNFKSMVPGMFIPADLNDVMWGVTEADILLGGTDGGDTVFSTDIQLYVGKLLEEQGILDPPRLLQFAKQTTLGISNQELAEMPELGEIFEANQADTRQELEDRTLGRLRELFSQIGSLQLNSSDLKEYKERMNRILRG